MSTRQSDIIRKTVTLNTCTNVVNCKTDGLSSLGPDTHVIFARHQKILQSNERNCRPCRQLGSSEEISKSILVWPVHSTSISASLLYLFTVYLLHSIISTILQHTIPSLIQPPIMVQTKEFRIVMPVSLDEYQIAQAYMVTKMQQQTTTNTEGVEVLENRPFEDDEFGKGQYTSKVYHLHSKAPAWLSTFAPADALIMQEEAWNAYPKCKTVIKCPYFPRFSLTVETIHKADNGNSDNVHGLSKDVLSTTQVEILDISSAVRDYWSYVVGAANVDFTEFRSMKTGRGPLREGWMDDSKPVMTAYKLVTIDAPYWGFGYRLEQALILGERALFLESHRNCFAWIDEWFGKTMLQIRELERKVDASLNNKLGRQNSLEREE